VSRFFTPTRLALVAGLALAAVVGAVLVAPTDDTYIFLPNEARPVEPLVDVAGAKAKPDEDGGGIYLVDVLVRKATRIESYFPSIRDGATLVPAHALNPTGLSEGARRRGNLREMTRSQRIAAAVALRELGYRVTARPRGAFVSQVFPDAPAAGKLRPADVIVAVDGREVRTPADLRRLIGVRSPGDRVRIAVRRGTRRIELELATIPDRQGGSRPVIGVLIEPEADIRLPLEVEIDAGDVGGPSAGLAFALTLLEELGRDVDEGRKIAVTGEIELDGDVVAVGGIRQKVIGAKRSGVDAFVVPAGDNATEARRHADGLRVVPVRNFQQALQALSTLS
jgi:PDZ domain-containing protein